MALPSDRNAGLAVTYRSLTQARALSDPLPSSMTAVNFINRERFQVIVSRFDFQHFKKRIPLELRVKVYEHVLAVGHHILPHFCDKEGIRGQPKFHDEDGHFHNNVWNIMSLTRVSREVKEESLKVFYSVNSFAVGPDTVTYFTYLQNIERFDWVERVRLAIPFKKSQTAPWILRCVTRFNDEVDSHKRNVQEESETRDTILQRLLGPSSPIINNSKKGRMLLTAKEVMRLEADYVVR
ncbi:hypothetical protein SLS59_003628 [Nothophoma quercina]|uniref:Uncharacterized protein n=1 Tax=Nothophoma quercina TaxID=749835 RepID=A0ABR3RJ01_9PLEO